MGGAGAQGPLHQGERQALGLQGLGDLLDQAVAQQGHQGLGAGIDAQAVQAEGQGLAVP